MSNGIFSGKRNNSASSSLKITYSQPMIKISTRENHFSGTLQKSQTKIQKVEYEPDILTIANILSYSKNLEIKKSNLMDEFQILKS